MISREINVLESNSTGQKEDAYAFLIVAHALVSRQFGRLQLLKESSRAGLLANSPRLLLCPPKLIILIDSLANNQE